MAASAYNDLVQKLYIAYFGRPADPTGLTYWTSQIDAAGGNPATAIAGFAASSESGNLYGGLPIAQKISAIYLNLFNRMPEPAGLAYWANLLGNGATTQAEAAYQILTLAGPGDASSIANKLAIANAFTAQLDTPGEITGYSGANAALQARTFLAGVDATQASVSISTGKLNDTVSVVTGVKPVATTPSGPTIPTTATTFTLTPGTDNFIGSNDADTFLATVDTTTPANSTLTTGDVIDGRFGGDSLKVTVTGNAAGTVPTFSATSIESLYIRDTTTSGTKSTYDLVGNKFSTVYSDVSTTTAGVRFNNMSSAAVVVAGNGIASVSNVEFSAINKATSVFVSFSDGVKGASIVKNLDGTAASAYINSYGATNTAGTLTLAGSATNSITDVGVYVTSDLTVTLVSSDFASTGLLQFSGTANVNLGSTVGFDGATVGGALSSGGITMALSSNTTSFFGGSGNDRLLGTATIADNASIDGNSGVDTLTVTLVNGTNGAVFKNFEILDLGGAASNGALDVASLTKSTITGVSLSGSAPSGSYTLNNLKDNPSGFNVDVSSNYTSALLTLNFANVTGSNDSLNLNFSASSGIAQIGTFVANGIETINLASGGAGNQPNAATILGDALKVLNITGSHDTYLTLAAQSGANTVLTTVDASAATGGLVLLLNPTLGTTVQSALTVKGSAGNDQIVAYTSAQSGSVGATITTGNGTDKITLNFATVQDVSAASTVQYTTITDLGAGDSLVFGSSTVYGSQKIVDQNQDLRTAMTLAVSNANEMTWFYYHDDTYIMVDGDGTGALSNSDILVKLTGTVNLGVSTMSNGVLTYVAGA